MPACKHFHDVNSGRDSFTSLDGRVRERERDFLPALGNIQLYTMYYSFFFSEYLEKGLIGHLIRYTYLPFFFAPPWLFHQQCDTLAKWMVFARAWPTRLTTSPIRERMDGTHYAPFFDQTRRMPLAFIAGMLGRVFFKLNPRGVN